MNAKSVAGWAGALGAVATTTVLYVGPFKSSMKELVAQESRSVAVAVVKEETAIQIQKLSSIEDLLRSQNDFDMREACEEKRSRIRCKQESEYRWAVWTWQDCKADRGEDHPACVEPEPLPED